MTRLEAILLGLLAERPRTGYELIKAIGGSPSLGVRATAGSVYPALQRLAREGLIRAEDVSEGARTASSYHLTPSGEAGFDRWLQEPVSFGTAAETEDLLLRVLFSERMGRDRLRTLLRGYQEAMAAQLAALEAAAPCWEALPLNQRLCLENGLRSVRTQQDWARWCLEELNR